MHIIFIKSGYLYFCHYGFDLGLDMGWVTIDRHLIHDELKCQSVMVYFISIALCYFVVTSLSMTNEITNH
jgi:hypothetical protein